MEFTNEKYFYISGDGYVGIEKLYNNSENLREVIIPININGIDVNGIDHDAFLYFSNLEKIKIPEGAIVIKDIAFIGCTNLKEVILPNSLERIDGGVFYSCMSLKSINIPDSVCCIGEFCFGNSGIENIKLPENLKEIGYCAFDVCKNLKEIHIPKNVKLIDKCAFSYCANLSKVYIYNRDIKIDPYAFFNSHNVELIFVD